MLEIRMGSWKRVVLKCFLLLVMVAVMVFVYSAATLRLKEAGILVFTNTTSISWDPVNEAVSRKLTSDFSHPFGFRLSNSELEELVLQEFERKTDSDKLIFMHSKLKTTTPITNSKSTSTRHSIKTILGIPFSERGIPTSAFHNVGIVTSSLIAKKHIWNSIKQRELTVDDIPKVRVQPVNCAKLIQGDAREQVKADIYQKRHPKVTTSNKQLYEETTNCTKFISERQYIQTSVSEEEAKFPLAFSILLFKDVEQFERLLRAVYRPQNFYCIHVDNKSEKAVQKTVSAIVECFENVFMAPEQFAIEWGTFSVLEPELSCMRELLKYKKWKYFINLTGQEFPLKTNWEIVQILKIFNGANNLEGTVKRRNTDRTASKPPTPANITLTKGSVHIVGTRKFIEYVIYNETSLKFREWVKDTYVPDETYFTSLNFNPHLQVPGSYLGIPETDTRKNLFITRFKNWGDGPFDWPCGGKRVRMVCIFSVRDLPLLASRVELFANKFYIDYEPLALDCMEELHYNRTRLELLDGPNINGTFYEDLDFVRNHLQ